AVADAVLTPGTKARSPQRREPHPLVEPLLRERLPAAVGEHVIVRPGSPRGVPDRVEPGEDGRVVGAVDLARPGLRLGLDLAKARHPAGIDADHATAEVQVPEAEAQRDDLRGPPTEPEPYVVERTVDDGNGREELGDLHRRERV